MRATAKNVPNPLTGRSVTTKAHGEAVPSSALAMWGKFLEVAEKPKKEKPKKEKPKSNPEPETLETPIEDKS